MIIDRKSLEQLPRFETHDSVEEASAAFLENPTDLLLKAYRQCGPIFRMAMGGEWKVVLTGVESNDFIWRNPRHFSYGTSNKPFLEQMGHDHLTGLDGEHHKLKKKILKPAFGMDGAMRYLSVFNATMASKLAAVSHEEPTEMAELWARSIIEINSNTVAKTELDAEMIEIMSEWERQFLKGLVMGEARHEYFAREEYNALKKEVFTKFHEIIAERLDQPSDLDDNLAEVIKMRAEVEDPLDRDNIANDLYFILVAGVHNTSALINASLHLTYTRPEWLAELREEVDAWDGRDLGAFMGMPKLKATIMEAQRLLPPVNIQGKYVVKAFNFDGYHIPEGTHFFHANALCHFLEEYYEEPRAFRPERFVEEGKFVPKTMGFFGGGTHLCLGRNHSMLQTPVVVAQVVKNFDLKFHYDPPLQVKLSNPRRLATPHYPSTFIPR